MATPSRGIRRYFRDSINHGTVAKFIVRPKSLENLVNAGGNTVEKSRAPTPSAVIFRICSIDLFIFFLFFFLSLLICRSIRAICPDFVCRLGRFSSYTCDVKFIPSDIWELDPSIDCFFFFFYFILFKFFRFECCIERINSFNF